MNDPLSEFRSPLRTVEDLHERVKHSDKIRKELIKVKVGDWKTLYTDKINGSYWAEEYPFSGMHGGGPSCFFQIEGTNPVATFDLQDYFTNSIVEESEKKGFWDALGNDEGNQICRVNLCDENNIKYSAFCKKHHYENIIKEPCPY